MRSILHELERKTPFLFSFGGLSRLGASFSNAQTPKTLLLIASATSLALMRLS